ncbi:hypothetical protein PR048_019909 [Dryococelus australis]|uniref:Uncharacterized protein n=1 Tax=Dryococelus australis TaxID=614101 RepID=A0ABQ9H4T1_9NEOP|nr:hypothetical protein PR048_019909 [Dryococelus australis]
MASTGEIIVELMQKILREAKKDNTIVVLPCLEVHKLKENPHQGCYSEIQMFDKILPRMSVLTRALPSRHVNFSARVYFTCNTPSYLIAVEYLSPKDSKVPTLKKLFGPKAFSTRIGSTRQIPRSLCDDQAVIKKLGDNNMSVVTQAIETFPELQFASVGLDPVHLRQRQCQVRANHIDTLLREYHIELTATLEALGASREQTISLMQLRDEFDKKMLYGFFYVVCVLPFLAMDSVDDNADEFSKDGVDKQNPLVTDYYLTCLRRLLPIFSQRKIFIEVKESV